MEIVWFAQSIDDTAIDVVKSNRIIEDPSERSSLVFEAQKGVSIRRDKEYEVRFFLGWPWIMRGYLKPDRASVNGRVRVGIFMAKCKTEPAEKIGEEVRRSLERVGIEVSPQQMDRFICDLVLRIKKWRRRFAIALLALALAATTAASYKVVAGGGQRQCCGQNEMVSK